MKNLNVSLRAVFICIGIFYVSQSYALTPNLLISKNKTITSSNTSNLASVIDGKYSGGWNISANSWIAINVGKGPSKVFFLWDSPMQIWSDSVALPLAVGKSCWQTVNMPFEYAISTSDSSTTGADGQWTDAVSIKNNVVAGRGHLVDFTGKSWIKMSIAKGTGQIDEIGVFDASKGIEDSWIFIGTSISQMAFRSTPPANCFADLVTKSHSEFTPAMIRGGIGCIFSANLADDVSKYLANAGNVHFWAIEMGTNDCWDKLNASIFKANLQRVIDSCRARQIEPIIARLIATNQAKVGWQVTPEYLAAIDDLTAKNKLIPGPDLYTYFLQHQSELNSDGVHPSAAGSASIQRLWAEKMDSLYTATSVKPRHSSIMKQPKLCIAPTRKSLILSTEAPGKASIFSIKGELLERKSPVTGFQLTVVNTKLER